MLKLSNFKVYVFYLQCNINLALQLYKKNHIFITFCKSPSNCEMFSVYFSEMELKQQGAFKVNNPLENYFIWYRWNIFNVIYLIKMKFWYGYKQKMWRKSISITKFFKVPIILLMSSFIFSLHCSNSSLWKE